MGTWRIGWGCPEEINRHCVSGKIMINNQCEIFTFDFHANTYYIYILTCICTYANIHVHLHVYIYIHIQNIDHLHIHTYTFAFPPTHTTVAQWWRPCGRFGSAKRPHGTRQSLQVRWGHPPVGSLLVYYQYVGYICTYTHIYIYICITWIDMSWYDKVWNDMIWFDMWYDLTLSHMM